MQIFVGFWQSPNIPHHLQNHLWSMVNLELSYEILQESDQQHPKIAHIWLPFNHFKANEDLRICRTLIQLIVRLWAHPIWRSMDNNNFKRSVDIMMSNTLQRIQYYKKSMSIISSIQTHHSAPTSSISADQFAAEINAPRTRTASSRTNSAQPATSNPRSPPRPSAVACATTNCKYCCSKDPHSPAPD